jgi:hypothetical protein
MRGITLVGTRKGKPVVYWPGVLVGLLIVGGLQGGAYLLARRNVEGAYPFSLFLILLSLSFIIFATAIRMRLRFSPEELPRLDR